MLYTSCYTNGAVIASRPLAPVRASVGAPRFKLPYEIAGSCPMLMPRRYMLGIPRDQYEELYLQILDSHGVKRIRADFDRLSKLADGRDLVLLCFERLESPEEWCHRRLFADWWTDQTGEPVCELPLAARPAKGRRRSAAR